jgi:hypothetical protein
MPAFEVAVEDCGDRVGPPPEPSGSADEQSIDASLRSYAAKINACVRASGVPFPSTPVAATH